MLNLLNPNSTQQRNYLLQAPNVVGDARFHGGSNAQAAVNAAGIIVHEVKGNGVRISDHAWSLDEVICFAKFVAMEEQRKKYWYILLWLPLFLLSSYGALIGAIASYEYLSVPVDIYSDVSFRVLLGTPDHELTSLDSAIIIIACSLIWIPLLFVHPKLKRN
jgi:hypothetical protein